MELKLYIMKFVFTLVDKMQTFYICFYNAYVRMLIFDMIYLCTYVCTCIPTCITNKLTLLMLNHNSGVLAVCYFADYCNVEVLQ